MKSIALAALLIFGTQIASAQPGNPDVTDCKIAATQTRAIFHSDTGVLNVEITSPGRTQSFLGAEHRYLTPAQIDKDDLLSSLAQLANVSLAQVDYASVSVLAQTTDGAFVLVKFVDANEKVLGISGVNGMNPFRCQ